MEKKVGSEYDLIYMVDLPKILDFSILTPWDFLKGHYFGIKQVSESDSEKFAYFGGVIYGFGGEEELYRDDALLYGPKDRLFNYFTDVCIRHAVNILWLSRELKKMDNEKNDIENFNSIKRDWWGEFARRFTMFFNLYRVINLEKRLRRVFDVWPHGQLVKDNKCFGFCDSSTFFAMLNFCREVVNSFSEWIFVYSHKEITLSMVYEAFDLRFIDWIPKVCEFEGFFNGAGDRVFPKIISGDYDLKTEVDRVVKEMFYERIYVMDEMSKRDRYQPGISESEKEDYQHYCKEIQQQKDDGKLSFVQNSGKKRSLKERFSFSTGQCQFDSVDLHIPTGLAFEVLKKLVGKFGIVVGYRELDENSIDKEASEQLRKAKATIMRSFKICQVPCQVEAKIRFGYMIVKKTASKRAKKTHRN